MSLRDIALRRPPLAASLERAAIWIVLVLLFAIATSISDGFLRPVYLGNLLRQLSPIGISAVGVTFVMILGGIDLSVGAIISLAVVVCAVEMNGQMANLAWAIFAALAAGALVGAANGALAAFSRASPFILTLGSALAVYGISQIYSGGTLRGSVPPEFRAFFNHRLFGALPVLALSFLLIALAGGLVLRFSRYGRMLYLVGSNARAARWSGLPVRGLTLATYTLSGVLSAAAGIALLARSGVSNTLVGRGLEFDVLAAVVLGGTTFEGGSGSIGGTVAGLLVLFVSFNLVNMAGLNFNAQLFVRGLILVGASGLYSYLKSRNQ